MITKDWKTKGLRLIAQLAEAQATVAEAESRVAECEEQLAAIGLENVYVRQSIVAYVGLRCDHEGCEKFEAVDAWKVRNDGGSGSWLCPKHEQLKKDTIRVMRDGRLERGEITDEQAAEEIRAEAAT